MNIQALNETYISRFSRGTPDAMYDVGVGPKTEWQFLGAKFPAMRIYGCEPHPDQYARLLKERFPGPLAQVVIGEVEGTATLHVPTHDLKCCSLSPVPYANKTCEVKVWTLDRFDEQMGQPERTCYESTLRVASSQRFVVDRACWRRGGSGGPIS